MVPAGHMPMQVRNESMQSTFIVVTDAAAHMGGFLLSHRAHPHRKSLHTQLRSVLFDKCFATRHFRYLDRFVFSDLFSTHRHPLTTCFLLGVRSLLPPMPAAFDARYVNRRKPEVHHSGCPDLFVKGVRNEPSVCLCHLQWHPQNPHLLCHVFFKEGAESFFNLCVICP